jgi:aspartate/methionine/tyrosine aminotransferase
MICDTQRNSQHQRPFGDTLLTAVVDQQLAVSDTSMRPHMFFLSSGANELPPPPLYRSFLEMEFDQSGLLQCYTNGAGYPPLVNMIGAYETFRAGKTAAADILNTHSAVVTFGAAGAIAGVFSYIAKEEPLNVLQVDYNYPIFERAIIPFGGHIHQILPRNPTMPVSVEDAVSGILHFRPNAIVICNTSNPTGQSYDTSFMRGVFKAAKEIGSWIIYDRVCEFPIGPDAEIEYLPLALNEAVCNRLVVVNSISKTCSLPGLRLGWGFCPKPMAAYIAQSQFYQCENPPIIGVTPIILDLWLRMNYMAKNSHGALSSPDPDELCRVYDAGGLIREIPRRRAFADLFRSRAMEGLYEQHIRHLEAQVSVFHRNYDVFKAILKSRLNHCPATMKGYNIMVSRSDFHSTNLVNITYELLRQTGISVVPGACFVVSSELVRDVGSYFRLSLGTQESAFKAACERFAAWSPSL